MAVTSKQLASALIRSLEEGTNPKTLLKNFEGFLEKNNLQTLLPNIVKNLEREVIVLDKKNTALIKVSHEVKDATVKLIEKFIDKAKSDPVKVEIDESLIGGFKAYYQGQVFDGSVKNYLKELKLNLMK